MWSLYIGSSAVLSLTLLLQFNCLVGQDVPPPPQETGSAACPPNQTFVDCAVKCPDAFCPIDDSPQPLCYPPYPCDPGCICKLNYKYDKIGNCILARTCPKIKCTRQNEVFSSCPLACLAENCEDKDNQPATCNTLIENCQPKCICRKNFFRDINGLCVPKNQCPSCGINERYTNCVEGECNPKTCNDLGKPIACPSVTRCSPGCVCKEGFVKNNWGICIDQTKCPSCGGDRNAVSGCGNRCFDNCSNRNKTGVVCPLFCQLNGCDCRKGFFFSDAANRCVAPWFCPPIRT